MIQPRSVFIVVFLLGLVVTDVRAGEPLLADGAAVRGQEEIEIALRISIELFEEMTQDVVQMTVPVRERVEENMVIGEATGEGRTSVQLDVSDEHADFIITVAGTAAASLRSDVGPATAFLTSRARFTSQKRVRFDGATFRDGPAGTATRNCTKVDRVCAKRSGPIGHLVETVGQRIADKVTPQINSVAEDISQEMLSQTFDAAATELITELNQTTAFEQTLSKYFPETKHWKYHLATRESFLLAGVGPPGASFPDALGTDDGQPLALLEMWVRTTPGQAAMLELIADWDLAHDLLRDFLPEGEAAELAEDVRVTRRGEWSVIQIGLPKAPAPTTSGL